MFRNKKIWEYKQQFWDLFWGLFGKAYNVSRFSSFFFHFNQLFQLSVSNLSINHLFSSLISREQKFSTCYFHYYFYLFTSIGSESQLIATAHTINSIWLVSWVHWFIAYRSSFQTYCLFFAIILHFCCINLLFATSICPLCWFIDCRTFITLTNCLVWPHLYFASTHCSVNPYLYCLLTNCSVWPSLFFVVYTSPFRIFFHCISNYNG